MHISARSDYAVRACLTLAAAGPGARLTCEGMAAEQALPAKFLETILRQLKQAGVLISQRGAEGGYLLARPADELTVAELMRAVDGPLAEVRGLRPEHAGYTGSAANLQLVWIGVRAAVRSVLEQVTLADVLGGRMPAALTELIESTGAWRTR